jgi:hypothetical protein
MKVFFTAIFQIVNCIFSDGGFKSISRLSLCVCLLVTLPAHAKRLALVMGNDNYTSVTKLQKALSPVHADTTALEGTLAQQHELIRQADEYADLFTHAALIASAVVAKAMDEKAGGQS